ARAQALPEVRHPLSGAHPRRVRPVRSRADFRPSSYFSERQGHGPGIMQFDQCSVQSRFHGSHWNLEDIGNLAILESLVIRQNYYLTQESREPFDAGANTVPRLVAIDPIQRADAPAFEQIDQTADFTIGELFAVLIETEGLVAAVATQSI